MYNYKVESQMDRDLSHLQQDSDSSIGKHEDVQVKAQKIVEQAIILAKEQHLITSISESDDTSALSNTSGSDNHFQDTGALNETGTLNDSAESHSSTQKPEQIEERVEYIPRFENEAVIQEEEVAPPPVPVPRSSLENYIPSPDADSSGNVYENWEVNDMSATEAATDGQRRSRVLSDYSTSEATEHEEKRTEKIGNADSEVHEFVKKKKDEAHWEEVTTGGVKITRDECVEAVKVTRETSLTERQLSALEGFETLLNSTNHTGGINGFETERNIQIIETKERKVESTPIGEKNITNKDHIKVQVILQKPDEQQDEQHKEVDNTVKSNVKVEISAPEEEQQNHVESFTEEADADSHTPKVEEEEAVKPTLAATSESSPEPQVAHADKDSKHKHAKQKEIIVDKTREVRESGGHADKKKVKQSNSNSGGFFSKFKRKSHKDEVIVHKVDDDKSKKEKKENDRKEKEKKKQKEKEEKERRKQEKRSKKDSKSDRSDSASLATTPRSPGSVDLNKSFNSSLGGTVDDLDQQEVDEQPISPSIIEKSPEEVPVEISPPSPGPHTPQRSPELQTPPQHSPLYFEDEDMQSFEEAEIAYPIEVQVKSSSAAKQQTSAEAPEPKTRKSKIKVEHELDPKSYTLPRGNKEPEPQPKPYIEIPPKQSPSQMLAPMHSPDSGIGTGIDRSTISSSGGRTSGQFVIVAIDFGTTYSGYAFSFTRDPDCSIHMMRKWEGGDPGVINQKTPTTLLLKPNGEFHSFGFTARDSYHDLDTKDATRWLFFEKFKMLLHHDANLNKDTLMKAANGKTIPAMTVFCHALRFFKDHALQEITDQSDTKITNEDVKWVITVPAIWKAPAKQFMRQAAYIAGIASDEFPDQLLVSLEPEAASIYVRRLRMYQLIPEVQERLPLSPKKVDPVHNQFNVDRVGDEFRDESFEHDSPYSSPVSTPRTPRSPGSGGVHDDSLVPFLNSDTVASEVEVPGTRYMIVDCGGGTVDITVHEMDAKTGKLRELYKATGGPYGSVGVDLAFEALIIEIFGEDFIEAFKTKYPVGWVDLMIAFESRKRACNPRKTNPLNVALPFTFIHFYKKYKHSQVETAIRNYRDPSIRWSTQGMLRLNPEAMRRLFAPTLENIRMAIGDVLNNPSVKDIRYLFLVGGFAESGVLQQDIRNEFGHIVQMRIPQDTSLAILKGAVLFGLDPTIVNVRRSRMTYGVGVLNRFVHGKHPEEKLVSKDGIDWCTDIFDKFVVTDQPVALGDTVLRSYTPAKPGQKSSIINIYSCENSDIKYITDKDVSKCGTLCLDLTDVQYHVTLPKRREIQTRMVFGDTEIKISALDVTTGKCVRANIDFFK